MTEKYIRKILDARIYDLVRETPLEEARIMSRRLGNRILLKREDLQSVFSFKIRGAYNKLLCLSEEDRARGVIAASAGNHAQGVALSAQHLAIKAIIVMPRTTPTIKVNAVKSYGARVLLHGDSYDEAWSYSMQLVKEKGMTYVHPYDDPDIIAGQGTVAVEILRQCPEKLDAIFVAVGGGGLCAGVAAYVKYVRPGIRIIAVEPEDSACLELAMNSGRRGTLKHVGLFADGVAVKQIGREPFSVLKDRVDEVMTVSTDEMCASIKDIFEDTRSIVEPAGALSLAAIKKYVQREGCEGLTLVGINCGANMNFDRLRYISERTETGEKREAVLAVTIPEKPGSFKRFCKALSQRSITEFNYRYSDDLTPCADDPKNSAGSVAHIFVGVQVVSEADRASLVQELIKDGYPVVDFTDNEMAKLHTRHMVGGHGSVVANELVYRFEFPERPGALMQFLTALGSRWNISMFHYRNHGAAEGRVLIGLQVPRRERKKIVETLDALNYPYSNETENPAYQLFLS